MNLLTWTTAQYLVETLATMAFAISGIIGAARRRLDAVGVCVVAGLAAFGGGTVRDVLLDRRPFFWVEHGEMLWGVLFLSIGAMVFMRGRHFEPTERAMQWPDAIGLGLFAASGTQTALGLGNPPLVAVLMGMMTAVFGGVLRDIVCNDIPRVLSDHRPYALCAFAGGWLLVLCQWIGLDASLSFAAAALFASVLRLVAIHLDWQIPAWKTE
jgi:uncharacterized membrane protein YeiH